MTPLDLYLVRHEEAEDGGYDIHRALTSGGRRRMRAAAKKLVEEAELIDAITTSPLVRAVQTAEIIAAEVGLDGPVLIDTEIAAPRTIDDLIASLCGPPAGVNGLVVVGHEPTLSAVVARMLHGPMSGFSKGETYALRFDPGARTFTFRWRISPGGTQRVDVL